MTLEVREDPTKEPDEESLPHPLGAATDLLAPPGPGRPASRAADEHLPFIWHG